MCTCEPCSRRCLTGCAARSCSTTMRASRSARWPRCSAAPRARSRPTCSRRGPGCARRWGNPVTDPRDDLDASLDAQVHPLPPVPANFAATSGTFLGTLTGWVLGQAGVPGHCPIVAQDCTSIARTDDGGATWYGVPAPVTGAPDGPAGVGQIRFLDRNDGWAFGPELFATHDGRPFLTKISTGGLRGTALEARGDRALP